LALAGIYGQQRWQITALASIEALAAKAARM